MGAAGEIEKSQFVIEARELRRTEKNKDYGSGGVGGGLFIGNSKAK